MNMQTELLRELYASQGGLLTTDLPQVKIYLQWLGKAGSEIALG